MRISVLINAKAGKFNTGLIEKKIRDTLFRCDLSFCISNNLVEMEDFIVRALEAEADYFVLCGGDGTINKALQTLMFNRERLKIPPMIIVSLGTANDLATELGISKKVEYAVRSIFEGTPKTVDVIEISAENQRAYMLTNGGFGVPARSAELANFFRTRLREESCNLTNSEVVQFLAAKGYELSKAIGSKIYSLSLLEGVRSWRKSHLNLEFQIKGGQTFNVNSSIIMVNNQKSIGAKYIPAPYTCNSDGRMNVLWNKGADLVSVSKAALNIRSGDVNSSPYLESIETEELSIRSKNPDKKFDFFGDGEILLKSVSALEVKCLKSALAIMVRE